MSISLIFQYYAIINLILMPFSLWLVIRVSRKTDLLDKLDKQLDKIAMKGKQEKPKEKTEEDKPGEESKQQDNKEEPLPELEGVASFRILVGDIYYCHLGSQNRNEKLYKPQWETSNDFVGKIDNDGIFSALKQGTVTITCKREDDAFDPGTTVYQIEVVAFNESWFAQKILDYILNRRKKDEVLNLLLTRKIISEIPSRKIISYEGTENDRRLTVQFNRANEIERAAFLLKSTTEKAMDSIRAELAQRFDSVKLESGSDISVWMHRDSNMEHNEVDAYAFLKTVPGQTPVLAISQAWREYGEVEEFLRNIGMTQKLFSECLPDDTPIEIKAYMETETKETVPGKRTIPLPELPPVQDNAGSTSGNDNGNLQEDDTGEDGETENGGDAQRQDQADFPENLEHFPDMEENENE